MITENYEAYADGGTQKDFRISVVGEETVIENSNMLTESIKLDEALCSDENLRFGCCEASQFTVQVANVFDNFEGKNLAVTVTMDEETTKYGTFKVLSDKPTADRVWRTITAYDAMRDIINADVLEWYNALTFPMTIRAFRDSFFNHLGITQKAVTLINDSFEIKGGFSATGTLSGKTIISSICEFNGVFGHINRDGNFEYVSLDSASNFICPPYQNNSVTYEDYVTEAITKVTMRGSTDDIGTSVGVDGNEYIIQNNPLIYGTEGTQALITAITNLLNKISQVTFRPYSLGKTIGNPCVELGDSITISTKYQTINSYVIKRILSGIQALRDSYSATGNKVYPNKVNSIQEQINRTQGKMNELSRTVDETVSTVTRVEQIAEDAQETADGLAEDVQTANQNAQTALNNSNRAIVTDTLHYLATPLSSGVTTSTSGWTTTPQSVTATNKYLWTYHTYTYADSHTSDTTPVISGVYGDKGAKGDKGETGDNGTSVSITSTSVTYQTSTSGTTVPTGTWQSSVPTVAQGSYLWTRTIVNYSNNTSTTSYSVSYQGQNGANGTNGTSVTVSSIQYASSTSGTTAPTSGWQNTIPTVAQGSYLWTKTTYSNGSVAYTNSRQGVNGINGTNGTNGRGISNTTVTYQASTSNTTPPTGTWQTSVPSVTAGQYLWTRTVITYTDNTTSTSYSVARQGVNGTNGTNGTSVTITSQSVTYQVGSSGTTAPTGTWQSTPQATSTGQFLWTRTIVNYSNGTSTTSYSVSAHGLTGSRGATGVGISEVTPLYYVSNSSTVPSAPTSQVTTTTTTSYNTWTKGIPAMTTTYKYMFTCDQVKYTNNTFAWTTPVLDNALSTAVSEIKQMADQIVLKVDNNGNIVKVALSSNASTGSNVLIKGDNIQLDGNVTITSGFVLNAGVIQSQNYVANTSGTKINLTDGILETTNAILRGTVTAYNGIKLYSTYNNYIFKFTDFFWTSGDDWTFQIYAPTGNSIEPGRGEQTLISYGAQSDVPTFYGSVHDSTLTANRILVSDANKNIVSSNLSTSDLITTSGGTITGWLNYGDGTGRITAGNNVLFLAANSATHCVNYKNNRYVPILASAFNISSSRIVKENIVNMTEGEARKILSLRVVDFDYINGKKNQCGLIAEETLNIAPYCVDTPEDYDEEKAKQHIANGELPVVPGIDYSKLVAPLIKMVQMQQRQIDELKTTNTFYQNIILQMQAEIEQIKQKTEE